MISVSPGILWGKKFSRSQIAKFPFLLPEEMWRVVILGSSGMLGTYISKYLRKQEFDVVDLTRNDIDARFATIGSISKEIKKYMIDGKEIVIVNAIGLIKPSKASVIDYIRVDGRFPHTLESACMMNNWKLIHVSTDCVFGGRGKYTEEDIVDADDIYGMSKAAGDLTNSTVIRTSIIGEEVNHKYSLVEWLKSNAGKSVKGYKNWTWNGITCLQFAKVVESILLTGNFWKGVRHVFSPDTVSKYQLLQMINKKFNLNVTIEEVNADLGMEKTLSTVYEPIHIPTIEVQIGEMFEFPIE